MIVSGNDSLFLEKHNPISWTFIPQYSRASIVFWRSFNSLGFDFNHKF